MIDQENWVIGKIIFVVLNGALKRNRSSTVDTDGHRVGSNWPVQHRQNTFWKVFALMMTAGYRI